jgi:hypothetical protein
MSGRSRHETDNRRKINYFWLWRRWDFMAPDAARQLSAALDFDQLVGEHAERHDKGHLPVHVHHSNRHSTSFEKGVTVRVCGLRQQCRHDSMRFYIRSSGTDRRVHSIFDIQAS